MVFHKEELECLEKNTGKYIISSMPIKKKVKPETITYKLKFIDSVNLLTVHSLTDN